MGDPDVKTRLHERLRTVRATMLWKLEGVDEHDARRPLTGTGTNLLGLVKHVSVSEALYLGVVFDRPFDDLPARWWDPDTGLLPSTWATADEARAEVVDRSHRVAEHADVTIDRLALDAPGHVPWWPRPDIDLLEALLHVVTETSRHAGHADILREQVDGSVGTRSDDGALDGFDAAFWARHRAEVADAAQRAR